MNYFDPNWKLSSKPKDQFIEPGHQYEWAWLIINERFEK